MASCLTTNCVHTGSGWLMNIVNWRPQFMPISQLLINTFWKITTEWKEFCTVSSTSTVITSKDILTFQRQDICATHSTNWINTKLPNHNTKHTWNRCQNMVSTYKWQKWFMLWCISSLFIFKRPPYMSPQHALSWVADFQPHNRGNSDTRLCPSSVPRYIPCLQCLPVVFYCTVSSPSLSSSPSAIAAAALQVDPLLIPPSPRNPCPRFPHHPLAEVHCWSCYNVLHDNFLPL